MKSFVLLICLVLFSCVNHKKVMIPLLYGALMAASQGFPCLIR